MTKIVIIIIGSGIGNPEPRLPETLMGHESGRIKSDKSFMEEVPRRFDPETYPEDRNSTGLRRFLDTLNMIESDQVEPNKLHLIPNTGFLHNKGEELPDMGEAMKVFNESKFTHGDKFLPDQVLEAVDQCKDEEGKKWIKDQFLEVINSDIPEEEQVQKFMDIVENFHDTEPHRFIHSEACEYVAQSRKPNGNLLEKMVDYEMARNPDKTPEEIGELFGDGREPLGMDENQFREWATKEGFIETEKGLFLHPDEANTEEGKRMGKSWVDRVKNVISGDKAA